MTALKRLNGVTGLKVLTEALPKTLLASAVPPPSQLAAAHTEAVLMLIQLVISGRWGTAFEHPFPLYIIGLRARPIFRFGTGFMLKLFF